MHRIVRKYEAKSPNIDLEYHFFPELSVKAMRPDNIDDLDVSSLNELIFEVDSVIAHEDVKNSKYAVQLTLATEEKDIPRAWNIKLVIFGVFKVDEQCPEERRKQLVFVLGQSMLYGHCREILASLTARGPHNPVYLPTITFVPEEKKDNENDTKCESFS